MEMLYMLLLISMALMYKIYTDVNHNAFECLNLVGQVLIDF